MPLERHIYSVKMCFYFLRSRSLLIVLVRELYMWSLGLWLRLEAAAADACQGNSCSRDHM